MYNKPGPAPRFTPEGLQEKVAEYFQACDENTIVIDTTKGPVNRQRPCTISGLCVYLGISRKCWSEYSGRPDYQEICMVAKERCEARIIEGGLTGQLNPVMCIWVTKNDHSEHYSDKIDLGINQQPQQLDPNEIRRLIEERRARLTAGTE